MPFWRNDCEIISICRRFSILQLILLLFSIVFFYALFFLSVFYFSHKKEIKKLDTEFRLISEQKRSLDRIYLDLMRLEKEKSSVCNQINRLNAQKCDLSEFIMNMVQRYNLNCSDIKPVKSKQKDLVKKEFFQLTVKGSFKNIIRLFNGFQESKHLLKFCNLRFYKWKRDKIRLEMELKNVSANL